MNKKSSYLFRKVIVVTRNSDIYFSRSNIMEKPKDCQDIFLKDIFLKEALIPIKLVIKLALHFLKMHCIF